MTSIQRHFFQARFFILAVIVMFVLAIIDQTMVEQWLLYWREGIDRGQWWRLWTAHLTHGTFYHFAMNMLAAAGLYIFFVEYTDRKWFFSTALVMMPFCSLGLFLFNPELQWYTGFSGMVQAWLSFFLIRSWKQTPLINSIILVLQWGRIVYEHLPSYDVNYLQDLIGAAVAVDAHLYGASLGLITGLLCAWLDASKDASKTQ